jgi:hypothetical protein
MADQPTHATTDQAAVTIEPTPEARTPQEQLASMYDIDTSPEETVAQKAAAAPSPSVPEVKATEAPAQPKHTPLVLQRAAQHEVDPAELEDMSPAQAERMLNKLDRQRNAFEAAWAQQQAKAPEPAKPAEPEDEFGKLLKENGVEEKDWDPGLLKVLKAVASKGGDKKQAEEIAALKQELGFVRQQEQRRQLDQATEIIEGLFAQTDPAIVGKGRVHEITPEQFKARGEIIQASISINETFQKLGKQLTPQQLHEKAVAMLHGTTAKAPAAPAPQAPAAQAPAPAAPAKPSIEQELAEKASHWKHNGATARPRGGEHKEPKGPDRAAAALAQGMKEHGLDKEENFDAVLNGFPD